MFDADKGKAIDHDVVKLEFRLAVEMWKLSVLLLFRADLGRVERRRHHNRVDARVLEFNIHVFGRDFDIWRRYHVNGDLADHRRDERGRRGRVRVQVREVVLNAIAENGRRSMRAFARQINVNREVVRRVARSVHRPYWNIKQPKLRPQDPPRRLRFSQWFCDKERRTPCWSRRICFTDESIFTQAGVFNKQNNRIIKGIRAVYIISLKCPVIRGYKTRNLARLRGYKIPGVGQVRSCKVVKCPLIRGYKIQNLARSRGYKIPGLGPIRRHKVVKCPTVTDLHRVILKCLLCQLERFDDVYFEHRTLVQSALADLTKFQELEFPEVVVLGSDCHKEDWDRDTNKESTPAPGHGFAPKFFWDLLRNYSCCHSQTNKNVSYYINMSPWRAASRIHHDIQLSVLKCFHEPPHLK
ncbi:unnamed protein product [Trichogramma brassicae]|uniref:Transposase Tc1-like domain-containing protein n=1 Tax=Trichogramma brassicae TaxID=86971 RepID=A0A6H5IYQ5_9HYME|nr:unnamed protein product [Trichogramma brassicae]